MLKMMGKKTFRAILEIPSSPPQPGMGENMIRAKFTLNNNGYDNKFHLSFPSISVFNPSTHIFSPIKNKIIIPPLQEIQAVGQFS